jgi:hypothetical protein
MHAYKDAIRRTGGAYVLYPGDAQLTHRGFHEIIPGLGAFPLRPSKGDNGTGSLRSFILEILDHFINRTSQRERFAYRTFEIHKNPPDSENTLKEPLPETYGSNRGLLPDETYVLIGFYDSPEHYSWIKATGLYNFRTGSERGSLVIGKEEVSAKYVLLHTHGDKKSGDLWNIVSRGPKVYSRNALLRKGYPDKAKTEEGRNEGELQDVEKQYLVIEIAPVADSEFRNVTWDFRKLKNYEGGRHSAAPFTASLAELMKNRIR